MTPEAQRIAIAEARGWVWYRIPKSQYATREHRGLFHPKILEYPEQSERWKIRADGTERICNMEYMEREGYVPKINLDEMHEAEEMLDSSQLGRYMALLGAESNMTWTIVHSTAAQRSEAFLKTLGLWKEEE
jgi:hypothetical protein